MRRRSLHLTMRDGVRIAVDVHLPEALPSGKRVPTIVRQTRYFRGVDFRKPWDRLPIDWWFDHPAETRRRFVERGYAWVDVCARGSGASFGSRPCPWSPEEVADGREIVEFIVAQPWSNGRVGATGVSYDGTAADFLLLAGHPAVRAIAPRFSLFDVYADVAFPGGIHLSWFTEQWSRFNRELDDNRLDLAFARMAEIQLGAVSTWERGPMTLGLLARTRGPRLQGVSAWALRRLASGVRRVDADRDGALLADAVAAHRENFDIHAGALEITYRDDVNVSPTHPDECIDLFSPHRYADQLRASEAAILGISGWLDGGYPHSAIKRFCTLKTPGSRMILGPWDHGGLHDISPYSEGFESDFDHDEVLLRFFDQRLADDPSDGEPRVRYFTVGEEAWKSADEWPPPDARHEPWYFAENGGLTPVLPERTGRDEHRVDPDVGTGRRSRWVSLLGLLPPAGYADRSAIGRRLLVYRSAPLADPLEVTGHPLLELVARFDAPDVHVFVYLEDERPDGRVEYVTEGQLRALHRKLSNGAAPYAGPAPYRSFARADAEPLKPGEPVELVVDLLPISWRFGRGHRIRVALAGADADHFASLSPIPTWSVERGGRAGSRLMLPVVGRR
jgi:putative CocE/NonD family hydrolase